VQPVPRALITHAHGDHARRLTSAYGVGRKRGEWWKWKIDPYSIDAVLIYAQPGSGTRASLLTDYTFGVWHEGALIPFAKAYSGLSNEEIGELDTWIRRHTTERFGPVRHVAPAQVFELGFEGIAESSPPQVRDCRAISPHAALAEGRDAG
jgi:DNA ligase-1